MSNMQVIKDIPVWGNPVDRKSFEQLRRCLLQGADGAAMMADHHLGYAVPIGGVLAYRDKINLSGVGYDIGCGNKAAVFDVSADDVRKDIGHIMDEIQRRVSFGMGHVNSVKVDHDLFDDDAWRNPAVSHLKEMARQQLGTVGGGNHYVDIFFDENDMVWVGVHFGSRGLGHKIATHFLKAAGAKDGIDADACVLDASSEIANDYIECMTLAGRYAEAGRDWVCAEVAKILGHEPFNEVHNHHNFAWRETHFGERFWVVRKGATPAFPGQKSFIGGSMGDLSVIVKGLESEDSEYAFYSTVHGAGRVMSRNEARGKIDRKTGEIKRPGVVTREMMLSALEKFDVELRGGDLDEAPQCYKNMMDVLDQHEGMIEIIHVLRPVGVAMAGRETRDDYKD